MTQGSTKMWGKTIHQFEGDKIYNTKNQWIGFRENFGIPWDFSMKYGGGSTGSTVNLPTALGFKPRGLQNHLAQRMITDGFAVDISVKRELERDRT